LIEEALGKKANVEMLESQPGDVSVTYADISKAKRLLGYQPKVKIEEGIKRFVEWYKRENPSNSK
jgi:UDP-glucuronate 4-epimerase